MRTIVATLGWRLHIVKLSDLFASPTTLTLDPSSSTLTAHLADSTLSPVEQLRSLLAPLPATSRASLLSSLLSTLLHTTAHRLGHTILVTGETSTRLAINTIVCMSLGRGWAMGEETGWEWEDERGIVQVRPMRGVVDEEVRYYNAEMGLEWVEGVADPRDGVEPKKAGIAAVCEGMCRPRAQSVRHAERKRTTS